MVITAVTGTGYHGTEAVRHKAVTVKEVEGPNVRDHGHNHNCGHKITIMTTQNNQSEVERTRAAQHSNGGREIKDHARGAGQTNGEYHS